MKTLVVLTALALAACASVPHNGTNGATAASGSYYCWRDRLQTQGDQLVCNWDTDKRAACDATYVTGLPRSAVVSGPADVRRCDNGQWLIMVTMR